MTTHGSGQVKELTGRVALVTGGAVRVGLEIARALADAGAAVLLPERDLSPQSLADVVTTLVADPPRLASLASAARTRGHPDAARVMMSKILTLVG